MQSRNLAIKKKSLFPGIFKWENVQEYLYEGNFMEYLIAFCNIHITRLLLQGKLKIADVILSTA
jgi:hypothetical protein